MTQLQGHSDKISGSIKYKSVLILLPNGVRVVYSAFMFGMSVSGVDGHNVGAAT